MSPRWALSRTADCAGAAAGVEGRKPSLQDLYAAVMEGAVERVRPKMMTVFAIMGGLLPILWGSGTGASVMKRIAAPMIGGMVSSTVLTLLVIPAVYSLWRERGLAAARVKPTGESSASSDPKPVYGLLSSREMKPLIVWGATLAFLVSAACERQAGERTERDSPAVSEEVAVATPGVPPADTAGSGSINWTLADLHHRLRAVGLNAVASGEVRQPFMGGPGMRYKLEGGELQAYIYADAGALARDTDQLDTATVSPPTMMISWVMPPTLIVSNNLALILLTRDPMLRKKIRDAVRPDLYRHDVSP